MGAYEVLVLALAVVAAVSYQAEAAEICAGCPVKHNPESFPVEKLNRALATAQVNEGVVKVLSVKTQVVAGLRYEVVFESASGKTCTATWVDAPWESKYPLGTQVSCKAKRSLLGAFEDVTGDELADMKPLSETAANEGTNGYRRMVVDVLKAQKKVVNGMMYKVKYVVKTTSCKMEQVPDAECMNKETAPRQVCESMFYTAPYLVHGQSHVEVMNTECQTQFVNFMAAPAGKLTDGHDEKDLADVEMYAVYVANQGINSLYYQGLYKIESVEEKLQAGGKLYNIKFQLRNTECLKKDGFVSSEKCHFANDKTVDTECSFSIWLWPFTGYKRVEASACASASA